MNTLEGDALKPIFDRPGELMSKSADRPKTKTRHDSRPRKGVLLILPRALESGNDVRNRARG